MTPLVPVETASRGNDLHNHDKAADGQRGKAPAVKPQPLLSQTDTGAASLRYGVRYVAPLVAQIIGQALGSDRPDASRVREAYEREKVRRFSGARLDRQV